VTSVLQQLFGMNKLNCGAGNGASVAVCSASSCASPLHPILLLCGGCRPVDHVAASLSLSVCVQSSSALSGEVAMADIPLAWLESVCVSDSQNSGGNWWEEDGRPGGAEESKLKYIALWVPVQTPGGTHCGDVQVLLLCVPSAAASARADHEQASIRALLREMDSAWTDAALTSSGRGKPTSVQHRLSHAAISTDCALASGPSVCLFQHTPFRLSRALDSSSSGQSWSQKQYLQISVQRCRFIPADLLGQFSLDARASMGADNTSSQVFVTVVLRALSLGSTTRVGRARQTQNISPAPVSLSAGDESVLHHDDVSYNRSGHNLYILPPVPLHEETGIASWLQHESSTARAHTAFGIDKKTGIAIGVSGVQVSVGIADVESLSRIQVSVYACVASSPVSASANVRDYCEQPASSRVHCLCVSEEVVSVAALLQDYSSGPTHAPDFRWMALCGRSQPSRSGVAPVEIQLATRMISNAVTESGQSGQLLSTVHSVSLETTPGFLRTQVCMHVHKLHIIHFTCFI
jgi:hypothetical protein